MSSSLRSWLFHLKFLIGSGLHIAQLYRFFASRYMMSHDNPGDV